VQQQEAPGAVLRPGAFLFPRKENALDVYLYAEGGVLPAQYDYDLGTDGVLADSKRQNTRAKGIIMIVLKRGDKLPTAEQKKAISNIKTLNPTWRLKTFYQGN
jgi:hypothetical protein